MNNGHRAKYLTSEKLVFLANTLYESANLKQMITTELIDRICSDVDSSF